MKPAPFEYHAPDTLEEVLHLLAEHGDEGKIIAGGQSLVPMLSMRLARPTQLIDVNGVTALAGVELAGGALRIGATTRERDVERSPLVAPNAPALAEALPLIGHLAIRNRGTVGGSLAHADASAELPAVAVATDASMVVQGPGGERVVSADDFFLGHYTTTIEDDECLLRVDIPTVTRVGGMGRPGGRPPARRLRPRRRGGHGRPGRRRHDRAGAAVPVRGGGAAAAGARRRVVPGRGGGHRSRRSRRRPPTPPATSRPAATCTARATTDVTSPG